MMQFAQVCLTSAGVVSASTTGTTVTSGGSPGTFSSSFTTISSSVDCDSQGFFLYVLAGSSERTQIKLYVGAAASETEFVYTAIANGGGENVMFIPILLPEGIRVSAKTASTGYSTTSYVWLGFVRGTSPIPLATRGTLIGTTSSEATNIDCGGTANTKSGWAQLTSSTARDAKGFTAHIYQDASSATTNNVLMDFGVGASSSEQIILADALHYAEEYRSRGMTYGPIWTPIPASSRLAARAQSTTNSAGSRVPMAAMTLWE